MSLSGLFKKLREAHCRPDLNRPDSLFIHAVVGVFEAEDGGGDQDEVATIVVADVSKLGCTHLRWSEVNTSVTERLYRELGEIDTGTSVAMHDLGEGAEGRRVVKRDRDAPCSTRDLECVLAGALWRQDVGAATGLFSQQLLAQVAEGWLGGYLLESMLPVLLFWDEMWVNHIFWLVERIVEQTVIIRSHEGILLSQLGW